MHLDCLGTRVDFAYTLYATTLIPLGATALVFLGECIRVAIWKDGWLSVRSVGFKWLLIVVFFFLPAISRVVTSYYGCDVFSAGDAYEGTEEYMQVDNSIACGTKKHASIVTYATIMIAVFPVGTPCVMFLLLWSRANDIRTRMTRDGDDTLASLSFLFRMYDRKHWWMGVLDMIRRLCLGSILLFLTAPAQIVAALIITLVFTVAVREKRLHYDASMDRVYYFTSLVTGMCVNALLLMDARSLGFDINETLISILLILTNGAVVWLCGHSADHIRRVANESKILFLFDQVNSLDQEDKDLFDGAFNKYVVEAPPGAEDDMYAKLKILVDMTKGATVVQPPTLNTVEALLEASEKHNDAAHAYIGAIMAECGAEYHAGPVKMANRIQAKADADYGGDVTKVIDTVRGSGMFHSIVGYTKAVQMLSEGGEGKPRVLRAKDKVTTPLPNGYRDVLLNLTVPDTEGLVCELQLHFHEIHEVRGSRQGAPN